MKGTIVTSDKIVSNNQRDVWHDTSWLLKRNIDVDGRFEWKSLEITMALRQISRTFVMLSVHLRFWGGDFQKLDFIPEGRLGEGWMASVTSKISIVLPCLYLKSAQIYWCINFHGRFLCSFCWSNRWSHVLNVPVIQCAPILWSSQKLEWNLLIPDKSVPFLRLVYRLC